MTQINGDQKKPLLFVVMLHYTVPLEAIDALRAEHLDYLDLWIERGVFLVMGPQVPRTGGVIIAQSDSMGELETILSEDPFHRAGAATYTITVFRPSRVHSDLSLLINHAA